MEGGDRGTMPHSSATADRSCGDGQNGNGGDPGQGDEESYYDGESCYSSRSCNSYASEMTARTGEESARSSRGGGGRGEQGGDSHRALKGTAPGQGQANGAPPSQPGMKVLSLADLQGQGLPVEALRQPEQQVGGGGAPLSARSGRSEGGQSHRSAKSCRSEGGQSEGGQSVASVSIRKYMGYLSEKRSPAEVKKMVKEFVRQMVKGREMGVLRGDGALKPVLCGLTRSLDTFRIKSGAETRKVKLSEVERVLHGNPEELSDLETPLDDSCATLELMSSECISFKFAERKAAELFTLCLQLFIDGQKK